MAIQSIIAGPGASRARLRNTASAIAVAVLLGLQPLSADAEDGGSMYFEFSYGKPQGNDVPWAEAFPAANVVSVFPSQSYEFGFGLIHDAPASWSAGGTDWDVGLFARFGATNRETESGLASPYFNVIGGNYATFYTFGRVEHRETHAIIDFEARRDLGFGGDSGIDATIGLGGRFAHFNASTSTEFIYLPLPAFTMREERDLTFTGIGPRVSLDLSAPIADKVSLDFSGGASLLFGSRKVDISAVGGLPFVSNTVSTNVSATVPTLDASLAVSFGFDQPVEGGKLSIGVAGDAWYGIYDTRNTVSITASSFGEADADRYNWRAFMRYTIPF